MGNHPSGTKGAKNEQRKNNKKIEDEITELQLADILLTSPFEIFMTGYSGAGTSAIVTNYVQNRFRLDWDPTIEDSFTKRTKMFGCDVELSLLDSCGLEMYNDMRNYHFVRYLGICLVFSVDSRNSFDDLDHFIQQCLRCKDASNFSEIPFVIVGNKIDRADRREVTFEEAKKYADNYKVPYIETSAKYAINLTLIFEALFAQYLVKIHSKTNTLKPNIIEKLKQNLSLINCKNSWNDFCPSLWINKHIIDLDGFSMQGITEMFGYLKEKPINNFRYTSVKQDDASLFIEYFGLNLCKKLFRLNGISLSKENAKKFGKLLESTTIPRVTLILSDETLDDIGCVKYLVDGVVKNQKILSFEFVAAKKDLIKNVVPREDEWMLSGLNYAHFREQKHLDLLLNLYHQNLIHLFYMKKRYSILSFLSYFPLEIVSIIFSRYFLINTEYDMEPNYF